MTGSSQPGNSGSLQPGDLSTIKSLGLVIGGLLLVMFAFIGVSLVF